MEGVFWIYDDDGWPIGRSATAPGHSGDLSRLDLVLNAARSSVLEDGRQQECRGGDKPQRLGRIAQEASDEKGHPGDRQQDNRSAFTNHP